MSFDFFNQKPSNPLTFSESQNRFFRSFLPLLDPKNSGVVTPRATLQLMRASNLPEEAIRMIWQVANPSAKDPLGYEEIQAMIRLVAYAQNNIQISRQALEANVSCRAPQFTLPQNNSQQNPREQIREATRQPQQAMREQPKNMDLGEFEQLWKTLQGRSDQYVGGREVKKRFQTATNKDKLAQAWSLSSHTKKGYLTKGELFAFLQLINLAKNNQALPHEMPLDLKNIASKIDAANRKNNSSRSIPEEISQRLQKAQADHRLASQNYRGLSEGQEKVQNLIAWIQKFVAQSQQNNARLAAEVERLKAKQVEIYDKYNESVNRLQRVIQKQESIIQDLVGQLKNKQNLDSQRIKTFEAISERQMAPGRLDFKSNNEFSGPSGPSAASFQKKPQASINETSLNQSQADNPLYPYQVKVITLLNQVNPISPEQLPNVQKRIMGMSREELEVFYAQCMERLKQIESEPSKDKSAFQSESAVAVPQSKPESQKENFEFVSQVLMNVEVDPDDIEKKDESPVDFFA